MKHPLLPFSRNMVICLQMTGIDLITAILVLSGILLGIYRGFVASAGDIAGIAGGFAAASLTYTGPVKLLRQFEITGIAAELVCFLLTALFFSLILLMLIESLKKRIDIKHILDRIFGISTGIIEGFIFSGILFFIMSGSFNSAIEVHRSALPKHIIRFMPGVYKQSEKIGIVIPKMIYLPRDYADELNPMNKEIQFLKTDFSDFEGFTCMECGGKVQFEGYFPKIGAAFVPKFSCPDCGRTSCGCQTYEGFHRLYSKCPVDLAREKTRFDCGRWKNRKQISPAGPCPVDNKTLELWLWEPPKEY